MSSRPRMVIALAVALVASLAIRDSLAEDAGAWVIEPGPEAADAQKLGASEVTRAQGLAKQKKFAEAAAVLEKVARTWPASLHDCNLALAYLRSHQLTKAQLIWDIGALRNGERPKWCTGEVSSQLATELKASGFVPTTIEVVPGDAVVEVAGVTIRNVHTVWLPQGLATIKASADGRVAKVDTFTVAAPTARVAITLDAPPAPEPVATDAGVPVAPPDAPAAVVAPDAPQVQPLLVVNGEPVGRRKIALGVAVLGWASAGVLGYLTWHAREDANELYPTDPAFADATHRYDDYKIATLGASIVGAIGTGLYVFFLTREDKPLPRPGTIQIGGSPDGFGISYSGTFGGPR